MQVVAPADFAADEKGRRPVPPLELDQAFADWLTLGEGNQRIELRYFGQGHSDGDAFVIFPGEHTMAAGDIYVWHMSPLIDPGSGGSMLALPTSLTRAVHAIKGVDEVISGHTAVHTWDQFKSYAKFNHGLVQIAEQTLADGGPKQDALKELGRHPG